MRWLLAVAAVTALFTGSKAAEAASTLECGLFTEKRDYRTSDAVQLTISFRNKGSDAIYMPKLVVEGWGGSYSIWAKDARTGREILQKVMADGITPPPRSADSFMKIDPAQSHDLRVELSLSDLGLDKPGIYELRAECHSPIPERMNFGLPIWSREMGPTVSKTVSVAVH